MSTSFADSHPEAAKQWDYKKNGDLTPAMVTTYSNRKVGWICELGHKWDAPVYSRSYGCGCPYCGNKKVLKGFNDLKTTHPDLVAEWDYEKNGDVTPETITAGSSKKVGWRDKYGNKWDAVICNRIRQGSGSPYILGKRVAKGFNDLETLYPNVAAQWDYKKNGKFKPCMFTSKSNKRFWWKCEFGHSCLSAISDKTRGYGCNTCRLNGYQKKALEKGVRKRRNRINRELAKKWYKGEKKRSKSDKVSRVLDTTINDHYKYLRSRGETYRYADLVAVMLEIIREDEYNDTYGYQRMRNALLLKKETAKDDFPEVPREWSLREIMRRAGLIHKRDERKEGIRKARGRDTKSDNLINRDFTAENPYEKCVCDITEVACSGGKLYISIIVDCFNNEILGLSMADNMRAELVCDTLIMAVDYHPELCTNNAIVHSDRGRQYTSNLYRRYVAIYGIRQSMNSAAGRCIDNAKCESIWSHFKRELFYGRHNTKKMEMETVKTLIRQYFTDYWNNRRICNVNGGLPPAVKKRRYYETKS